MLFIMPLLTMQDNYNHVQLCWKLNSWKFEEFIQTRGWFAATKPCLFLWQFWTLVFHFEQLKIDTNYGKNNQYTDEGLYRKITTAKFILVLWLMVDALQELSELSLELQERSIALYTAHRKVQTLLKCLSRPPGPAYKQALQALKDLKF